ncbi:YdeI/OmpD-associated family protein [Riemerella anatipestifer]|nr:YdeI/OmpD-associated family protein [Riemerella anatipestifer]
MEIFNMKTINFTAEIIQHGTDNAGYVVFPFSTEELFGKKGQVKVKVLFDNKVSYRGSLAKMGKSYHFLILTKEIRASLNKTFGDTVEVSLQQDLEERVVVIPEEILTIFNAYPEVKLAYDKLSYTRKKELMLWITSAKKEETKERRKQQLPSIILEETQNK